MSLHVEGPKRVAQAVNLNVEFLEKSDAQARGGIWAGSWSGAQGGAGWGMIKVAVCTDERYRKDVQNVLPSYWRSSDVNWYVLWAHLKSNVEHIF